MPKGYTVQCKSMYLLFIVFQRANFLGSIFYHSVWQLPLGEKKSEVWMCKLNTCNLFHGFVCKKDDLSFVNSV